MTGSGVALDAASAACAVALVEGGDIGRGTSSKSSKMVHGGLRYLQQREFRLVYENLHRASAPARERTPPRSPTPLPHPPLRQGRDRLRRRVARSYRTALWLYDADRRLGGSGKRHRKLRPRRSPGGPPQSRRGPTSLPASSTGTRAGTMREWPSRSLRTRAADYGAVIAITRAGDRDHHPGRRRAGERGARAAEGDRRRAPPSTCAPRSSSTPSGVWVDRRDQASTRTMSGTRSRPAKGVHVTVPSSAPSPATTAAVIPVRDDRRSIFVVPWEDAPYTYIGTTDTAYDGRARRPARAFPRTWTIFLSAVNAVNDVGEPHRRRCHGRVGRVCDPCSRRSGRPAVNRAHRRSVAPPQVHDASDRVVRHHPWRVDHVPVDGRRHRRRASHVCCPGRRGAGRGPSSPTVPRRGGSRGGGAVAGVSITGNCQTKSSPPPRGVRDRGRLRWSAWPPLDETLLEPFADGLPYIGGRARLSRRAASWSSPLTTSCARRTRAHLI